MSKTKEPALCNPKTEIGCWKKICSSCQDRLILKKIGKVKFEVKE